MRKSVVYPFLLFLASIFLAVLCEMLRYGRNGVLFLSLLFMDPLRKKKKETFLSLLLVFFQTAGRARLRLWTSFCSSRYPHGHSTWSRRQVGACSIKFERNAISRNHRYSSRDRGQSSDLCHWLQKDMVQLYDVHTWLARCCVHLTGLLNGSRHFQGSRYYLEYIFSWIKRRIFGPWIIHIHTKGTTPSYTLYPPLVCVEIGAGCVGGWEKKKDTIRRPSV